MGRGVYRSGPKPPLVRRIGAVRKMLGTSDPVRVGQQEQRHFAPDEQVCDRPPACAGISGAMANA